MRRQRGFSLVEMLVAMGLAGLVVSGALQLQSSFTRQSNVQQAIGEVQQTLRSSMAVIARSVRTAGSGLANGYLPTPNCTIRGYYGVQFYNSNAFPPAVTFDSTLGISDTDPDWMRIIAATSDQAISTNAAHTATQTTVELVGGATAQASLWVPGDLMLYYSIAPPPIGQPNAIITACARSITGVAGNVITHSGGGTLATCINAATPTPCSPPVAGTNALVRRIAQEVDFRVFPAAAPLAPRLAMRMATVGDTTSNAWNLVAEGIEDMQIALVLRDGRICSSVDDPVICQPEMAAAVQVTLVGRTLSTVQGAPPSRTGGYEDEVLSAALNDGYIRRALTERIRLNGAN